MSKASSAHSGRSASSHRSRVEPIANEEADLPAIPDELLAALSRDPPREVVPPPAPLNGYASGRTSLAVERPPLLNMSGSGDSLDALRLPSIPPQSPFGLAYPLASASASPTTPRPPPQSPGKTPTSSVGGGFSANRTDSTALSLHSHDSHDAPPSSASAPHFPRGPSVSPESLRTTPPTAPPTVSPNKRNVFKAFSFGRPRASQPPPPSASSAHFALPPNLAPPPGTVPSAEHRPPSLWSRVASAPPALATTSAPPITSSSSSAAAGQRAPPAPPEAHPRDYRARSRERERERTRTDSSASASVSLSPSADDGDAGADRARWSARPGAQAEQYTRDLRGVRRGSAGSAGGAAAAEEEGEGEEGVPYEDEEDEGEGDPEEGAYAPPVPHVAHAVGRRPSVMSLRHQLAALPATTGARDEPVPLPLPVHVDGAAAGAEEARKLARLDLQDEPHSPVSSADFIVAVVGPRSVGKSTVIRRGLKRPPEAPTVLQEDGEGNRVTTSTTSFSISGVRRTIEVLEIDMGLLRYSEEGVIWPDGLPQCEGAMICYDSTDARSLSSLSLLLKAFWTRGSDVPLIVLACKAAPLSDPGGNAIDPKEAAAICNVYGAGIVTLDGGIDDPQRKTKECFNWLIRQIMDNRGELIRPPSSASASPTDSRRGSLRASSSIAYATTSSAPITSRPPSSPLPDTPAPAHGARASHLVRTDSLPLGLAVVEEAPLGADGQPAQGVKEDDEPDYDAEAAEAVAAMLASVARGEDDADVPYAPLAAPQEPEQQEKPPQEEHFSAGVVPYSPPAALERRGFKPQTLDLFFKRDDLIDKFLFASVAGNDEQFVTLFLITFRRFARPYDVLEKLIERFDFVASKQKTDPLLCRFGQMKLCGVLSTWMQNHPGDFTAPTTFGLLEPFLENLLPSGATWIAHYAFELVPLLPSVATLADPETGWALPDKPLDDPSFPPHPPSSAAPAAPDAPPRPMAMSRRGSLAPSYASSGSLAVDAASASASRLSVPASLETGETSPSIPQHRTASEAGAADTDDSTGGGVLARSRVPSSAVLVDLSNAVVEMREQDVATQITRIAWDLFGGMSPRDLMRHVLAPRDPHNPHVALRDAESPVVRSINFVNYLASWTATMILVQSKVKARARVIEKMLLVAAALREQENFDSLMGVLAGLNSQPVFRLTETMELVTTKLDGDPLANPQRTAQPDGDKHRLPKKLRSLNRLMAANKSFAAYRLALANSGIHMIPYLGVHLQDLTVTNEMKSDMRGGLVNWSKMSQMGKSAAIVLDCARVAPKLPVDRTIERCILNVPVLDEDRQYTLSYAHQPRQNGKTGTRTRLRELAKSTFA
ncbi:hypothetical protein JCM10450v2_000589 [Rhodotorula kratochvilovae]